MMKKLLIVILIVFLISFANTVFANSAAPMEGENGSGIVFEQNEKVKINREDLYIDIVSKGLAKVKATYEMENISHDFIEDMSTLFVTYNEWDAYNRDKEFKVMVNDIEIPYYRRYFKNYYNEHVIVNEEYLDWEKIIADSTCNEIEDKRVYYEYTIHDLPYISYIRNITSPIIYLSDTATLQSVRNNIEIDRVGNVPVEYKFLSPEKELKIIDSRDDSLNFEVKEIGDLTEHYRTNIYPDEQYEIAGLFAYINNCLKEAEHNNYFYKIYGCYNENYKDALLSIEYFLSFQPQEVITVSVEYDYMLECNSSYLKASTITFYYLLSPAKYWKDFKNISIYLTVNEEFQKITEATLEFEKIDTLKYYYHAEDLPKSELIIKMQYTPTVSSCMR